MRFLYNNSFYMYANDGHAPEKFTSAISIIRSYGVQFKKEGFCDGSHIGIYLPGNTSKTPDYRILDDSAHRPNYLPLDEALCEIYAKLGLEKPDLSVSAPAPRFRA